MCGAWYIYNNAERKLLWWGLCSAWAVSIVERFLYHSPIQKPTPLTFVYPAIALIAFAIDGYMEAKKKNLSEGATISSKILGALRMKK